MEYAGEYASGKNNKPTTNFAYYKGLSTCDTPMCVLCPPREHQCVSYGSLDVVSSPKTAACNSLEEFVSH